MGVAPGAFGDGIGTGDGVSGVGHGAPKATYNCRLPVAMRPTSQEKSITGHVDIQPIPNSDLPGLLGLSAFVVVLPFEGFDLKHLKYKKNI